MDPIVRKLLTGELDRQEGIKEWSETRVKTLEEENEGHRTTILQATARIKILEKALAEGGD